MKKNNMEKFTGEIDVYRRENPVKIILSGLGKILKTLLFLMIISGIIVAFTTITYLIKLSNEPTGIDLDAKSMNLTSFIYVQDEETGEFYEYQELYDSENRVWIDYKDIPDAMKKAIIAIEDKRFYQHNGVDWYRTGSAIISLATGSDSYGGSTITQQLIKNLTMDNEVSITRKLREIFKALNLEKEYSKDQILEAYLNVVNFGGSCQGIEAAAQLYFGKSATDCSIAESAAIVGITQNPSKWNPLIYPSNNKIRRETIIEEMYNQGKITETEYEQAMEESANMKFVGYTSQTVDEIDYDDDEEDLSNVPNWYIDSVFKQAAKELAETLNISEKAAKNKLYTEGLKIYCAMDLETQKMMEEEALNIDRGGNEGLEIAMTMVGYDGRIIATVGSSYPKEGALVWDRADDSTLQPGSSIKPMIVYPYAIDKGLINYSSLLKDEPLDNWGDNNDEEGPLNWYRSYYGSMTVFDAIEISSNATVAQLMAVIGPENAYNQAVNMLGFSKLTDIDRETLSGLSIGGLNGGVTVREMANAFTYIGNGGKVYEPYTYYYIEDQNGNIIIDHRNQIGKNAYSEETATIMNRLLYNNVMYGHSTAAPNAAVPDWEIVGKTGTTDDYHDSWFVGASPYATLAIWCGFDKPAVIQGSGTRCASVTFSKVMGRYLEDKPHKSFELSENLTTAKYCTATGKLYNSAVCTSGSIGYYKWDDMPDLCTAQDHHALNVDTQTEPTTETEETTDATESSEPTAENTDESESDNNNPPTRPPYIPPATFQTDPPPTEDDTNTEPQSVVTDPPESE